MWLQCYPIPQDEVGFMGVLDVYAACAVFLYVDDGGNLYFLS